MQKKLKKSFFQLYGEMKGKQSTEQTFGLFCARKTFSERGCQEIDSPLFSDTLVSYVCEKSTYIFVIG